MTFKHHKTLTEEKWASFGYSQQVTMIANELHRAGNWIADDDMAEAKLCYERAMELLALTIAVLKDSHRLYELFRFQEMLALLYIDPAQARLNNAALEKTLILLDSTSAKLMNL